MNSQNMELLFKAINNQHYNNCVSQPQWLRTTLSVLPIHVKTETDPIPEMFIIFLITRRRAKTTNQVFLSTIHRHNPWNWKASECLNPRFSSKFSYLSPAPKAIKVSIFSLSDRTLARYAVVRGETIWVWTTVPLRSRVRNIWHMTAGPKQKALSCNHSSTCVTAGVMVLGPYCLSCAPTSVLLSV
jgi:hypothetical protein